MQLHWTNYARLFTNGKFYIELDNGGRTLLTPEKIGLNGKIATPLPSKTLTLIPSRKISDLSSEEILEVFSGYEFNYQDVEIYWVQALKVFHIVIEEYHQYLELKNFKWHLLLNLINKGINPFNL